MHMISTKYTGVTPLHLHVLSQRWWDAHPGASSSEDALGRKNKRNKRKSTTDCFHVCYSPFVYEPIWWLLQHVVASAARRASGRSSSPKSAALGMAAKKAAKKAAAEQAEAKQKTKKTKARARVAF